MDSSSTPNEAPSFSRFPDLPVEVQHMIWEQAAGNENRVVFIDSVAPRTPFPTFMQANQQSRQETLPPRANSSWQLITTTSGTRYALNMDTDIFVANIYQGPAESTRNDNVLAQNASLYHLWPAPFHSDPSFSTQRLSAIQRFAIPAYGVHRGVWLLRMLSDVPMTSLRELIIIESDDFLPPCRTYWTRAAVFPRGAHEQTSLEVFDSLPGSLAEQFRRQQYVGEMIVRSGDAESQEPPTQQAVTLRLMRFDATGRYLEQSTRVNDDGETIPAIVELVIDIPGALDWGE